VLYGAVFEGLSKPRLKTLYCPGGRLVKFGNWKILTGISLLVLSVFVYFFHYIILGNLHHIFIYPVGDIAFVFIEVLLVILVIHGLLEDRFFKIFFTRLGNPAALRLKISPFSASEHR